MDYKAYALMAILLASVATVALIGTANAQTTSVTVSTDKTAYISGEKITISGTVTNVQEGQPVLIQVFNPKVALVRTDPVTVAADGSWTYEFPSGGKLMMESGAYEVRATYRGVTQEASFDFTAAEGWRTINAIIGGEPHEIRYQITGGTVESITGDVDLATLTVTLGSTSNGELRIELTRATIQALTVANQPTGGSDIGYEVFVDTIPSNDTDEETATSTARILKIPFEAGAEEIDIVGTWIIPEFGAIAAIVLAVAIVGIIVATARYGKLNSFAPRL
jgi:predicted secreted protein with PEFG-CTERM motif